MVEQRAGIIASKRCNNVEIYDNEVYDGGDEAVGIFLHRSTDDAVVYSKNKHTCLLVIFSLFAPEH